MKKLSLYLFFFILGSKVEAETNPTLDLQLKVEKEKAEQLPRVESAPTITPESSRLTALQPASASSHPSEIRHDPTKRYDSAKKDGAVCMAAIASVLASRQPSSTPLDPLQKKDFDR